MFIYRLVKKKEIDCSYGGGNSYALIIVFKHTYCCAPSKSLMLPLFTANAILVDSGWCLQWHVCQEC